MHHAPDHNEQQNIVQNTVPSSAPSPSKLSPIIGGLRRTFGKIAMLTALGTSALAVHPADAEAKKSHHHTHKVHHTHHAHHEKHHTSHAPKHATPKLPPPAPHAAPSKVTPKPQAPSHPEAAPAHPHGLSTFLPIPKEKITALVEKYSAESVTYALRIIENGQRIRTSPTKEQGLAAAKKEVEKKFSTRIKIPKWFGYIDDPRELQQVAAMHYSLMNMMKRGKKIGLDLDMEFLIGVMSNEGRVLDVFGQDDAWETPVDGFGGLGLDWFAKDFESIAEMGLIDTNFKQFFKEKICTNEKCKPVSSADFKNKGAALQAAIAELAYRQKLALIRLEKMGIKLDTLTTEKRKDVTRFLTYLFYNAGPGSASQIIAPYKTADELYDYFNRPQTNPGAINLTGSPANCYVVMAGAEWLSRAGATDPNASKKGLWWAQNTSPKK